MAKGSRDEWPKYYTDDVPPADAVNTGGHVFRIVTSIPPTREDFASTYEAAKYVRRKADWARQCGTSVHTSLTASQQTRSVYFPLKDLRIAEGFLQPSHGKMKKTGGPDHWTVWFRTSAAPEASICNDAEED